MKGMQPQDWSPYLFKPETLQKLLWKICKFEFNVTTEGK